MSIGWVMFFKAVAVAVCLALAERYRAFKSRRRDAGITLRYDARRAVYFDPLERLESRAKRVFWALLALFIAYGLLALYLILTV